MEGEEVCRTLLREIWVGLDGIPRQSSRSHLGSNRHPLPENAAPLMDNTCDLNHQLGALLRISRLPTKEKAAVEWCEKQGVEGISDIYNAELVSEFIDALQVKECRKEEIVQAFEDEILRTEPFRLRRPRPYGYASGTYKRMRIVHGGHRKVPPEEGGLTVDQFNFFLEHECVQLEIKWQ